ncbi:MAG: glycosyltransferase family 2 protein [Candidatus Bathyarchaeota archaeon]|nr:glycosyltransferase family 2 protein [Candidatus Bathyarchaeota archaeon]
MVEIQANGAALNNFDAVSGGLLVIAGIPAYNEEKTIARVVLGAQKYAHIVVVCDDGSADMTSEIAERLGAVVIRHEKNLGYGAALQSLFKRAKELNADVLVTLDSDGQHDPSEIPQLIKPIEDGVAEVVLGSRFKADSGTADMPKYRKFGIQVITKLANTSSSNGGGNVSDAQSGFRAYGKSALDQLSMYETGMSASVELLRAINKAGLRVYEVPISCKYATSVGAKTSTENPFTHGIGLVMSLVKLVVEERPLPFLGIPGAISIIIGVSFGLWLLDMFIKTREIVTNVALASIAFLLIGFFLTLTAIILYAITRLANKFNHSNQKRELI